MKLKNLIYLLLAAVLITAAGTGCKKGAFNINRDQNNPTDSTVTYDVVIPAALHATGTIVANQWGTIQNWMGYWARSGTYAPNVAEESYQITTGFGNGVWNSCYDNAYDYNIVQLKAAQAGAGFYEGIARIMKAYDFMTLVDVYGNVPYSEALKGSSNPTPKYDNGLAIYQDLLRQIDAGIALIKAADVSSTGPNKNIATNDIMFAGNKTLWAKFGNTLKLKMLIHTYAVAAINKTTEIGIINTEGSGYLGVGEDAQVNPGYKTDKPNPFYNSYKATTTGAQTANNVYYRANAWGIEYYKWDGDPRVTTSFGGSARIYEAGTGGLIGVAYGLPPVTANASSVLAGIGPGVYKSSTSAQPIITAGESFFLQAEARQRGWITSGPTAQALLLSAIIENMRYLGVANPTTSANAYIAGNASYPDVDYNGVPQGVGAPAGGLFTILSQKWFALNGIDPLEIWDDYRRVPYSEVATKIIATGATAPNDHFVYGDGGGFSPGPPISVAPQNTSTKIPVRYLYPQTEYNYNAGNVGAQGTVDPFTSRVFWDLQ
jgi:hypothetical protein